MYVKSKLIKSINEQYFRFYQDTSFSKIDENTDYITLTEEAIKCFTGNGTDMLAEVVDLVSVNETDDLERLLLVSTLANALRHNVFMFSEMMQLGVRDVTDVTKEVMDILALESDNACIVGGCVRDILTGKTPKDFDFATDTNYDRLEELFEKNGFKVQEEGKEFLVMIVSKGDEQFEIANFRKDGTYVDGRRPESVEIGTIYDDANRRDFTINALYYNLVRKSVMDPTGNGLDDIEAKVVRFVGKAKDRLAEDTIRAYRFYRFVDRGFNPDPKSLRAVREAILTENKKITKLVKESGSTEAIVSLERMRLEIEKMIGV